MAQEQQLEVVNNGRTERTGWLLNSPDPPGFFHEIFSSIRRTILPHGTRNHSSLPKKSSASKAFSFLQGLFPILEWGRNYRATKFKRDLMAGLTLASLCIPQVTKLLNNLWSFLFHILHWISAKMKRFSCCLTKSQCESCQSIGYANLAKLDPQYGLCKCWYTMLSEFFTCYLSISFMKHDCKDC